MDYRIARPSPLLSEYVKQYWAMESCLPANRSHIQRIVPTGMSDLTFYLGDRPVSLDDRKPLAGSAVLTGQQGDFFDIRVSGSMDLFSILFLPQGLPVFFDVPSSELYNQTVTLSDVCRQDAGEIEALLREARTFEERIRRVEAYLVKRLRNNRSRDHFGRIRHSIGLINRSRGLIGIDELAGEACLGRKQFERIFSRYVGASPRQFLKTVRFQSSIDLKARDPGANLTDITYRCGYYDQSHMVNDFRKLAGMSPTQFFQDCAPFSDYFH
ncbi:MAG: helix-turn-helix domain-containing protein [Bacteroidales bacterium]